MTITLGTRDLVLLNELMIACSKKGVSCSFNWQEFDHQWTIYIDSAAKDECYTSKAGVFDIQVEDAIKFVEEL